MTVVAYTDGSCNNKTGFGGWGYHYSLGATRFQDFGGEVNTTNNRMELQGVVEALKHLTAQDEVPPAIVIMSDSQYVVRGITTWIHTWKLSRWKTSAGKPVANRDLWEELYALVVTHKGVTFQWVKGHAGMDLNEYADELAGKGRALVEPAKDGS